MKFLQIVVALAVGADAFAPATRFASTSSSLFSRPDSSKAIEDAMEASKKFGASSPEARVAWDTVEEMDASDNSEAAKGSLDVECTVDESEECETYGEKLEQLAKLIEQNKPKLDDMRRMAQEVQAIKLSTETVKEQPENSDYQEALKAKMKEAIDNARKVSEEYGFDSPDARVAWDTVEEIASSGLGGAMGKRLDEECLVESAKEACMAIDELNRVMTLEKVRGDGGLNS